MSVELYANNYLSTLANPCGPGDSSITVASPPPSALLQLGQFRVMVDSEIMLVTGVSGASNTIFAVSRPQEGTNSSSHSAGAQVTHILTAGALQQILKNQAAQTLNKTTSIADPTALTFGTPIARFRPIEIVSPELRLIKDGFDCDAGFYQNKSGTATGTFTNGQLVFTNTNSFTQWYADVGSVKVPCYAAILEMNKPTSGGTFCDVYVGLMANPGSALDNGRIQAVFDFVNNNARVETGTGTAHGQVSFTAATGPFKIALVLIGNYAQVWYNEINNGIYKGWDLITSFDLNGLIDIRDPAVLSTFAPGFGVNSNTATTITLESFECGVYGQIGLRDPCIVLRKDGTPYVKNGDYFFALSCASATGFRSGDTTADSGHQGIFAFNPKAKTLRKIGAIFTKRGAPLIYNDYVSSLVFDDDLHAWHIFIASWGNAVLNTQLGVLHEIYYGDLLHGVTILSGLAFLNLSQFTGTKGCYDFSIMYDVTNSLWRAAYTVVPNTGFAGQIFYLAVDHSSDLSSWTNDFALSGVTGYEGSRLVKMGGNFYALAGSNANMKAYDMGGNLKGTLSITLPTTTDNPPWPAIFPLMEEGKTQWAMLTFDNTKPFGNSLTAIGTLLMYQASQTETGFEFDLYGSI